MIFKGGRSSAVRPSKAHQRHNDQLPFLSRTRFSALPHFRAAPNGDGVDVGHGAGEPKLTLFVAILYVIDMFGVFPFVTLPGLLVELGFFGIPLVLSVVVLQIYTSFLLSQCWSRAEALDATIVQKSRYPYAAIADLAYGPFASWLVTILLDLSIFAGGIPNLVMAAENLELAGEGIGGIGGGSFTLSFCYWTIIVGLLIAPLMWLGSPKHMRGLAILSLGVMVVIVVLLWFCLFAAAPFGPRFEGVRSELPSLRTALSGYSVLAFQFDIHPMLLTLQIDMRHKSQVCCAAFCGIVITCSIAIFGSVVAAYKFGSQIAENLLETLPKSVPLLCLLVLMALQLCFSATVASSAMFLQIENYLEISEVFSMKRAALRSGVVALQVLIAEFVPRFDVLMYVVGGTVTGPLVFILPPLLYRRIVRMERCRQRTATQASYGSIPLDLNYEALPPTALPPSASSSTALFHGQVGSCGLGRLCWQHTVQALASKRWQCDTSLPVAVLVFGSLATLCSTYLNVFRVSELFHNNSPCFGNFTSRI